MNPYLTYAGYQALGGKLSAEAFDNLLGPSSDVLDSMTRDFYHFHDLETDINYRKNKFKKALVAQIAFFDSRGSISVNNNDNFATVTIGRTALSKHVAANNNLKGTFVDLYSQDAIMYLLPTGLLYNGVGGGQCGC